MNPFAANKTTDESVLPADRLQQVRAEIKVLKDEEKGLVADVKEAGSMHGSRYMAEAVTEPRRSLNTSKLKDELGEKLEPFYETKDIVKVKVSEIKL